MLQRRSRDSAQAAYGHTPIFGLTHIYYTRFHFELQPLFVKISEMFEIIMHITNINIQNIQDFTNKFTKYWKKSDIIQMLCYIYSCICE